LLLSEVGYREGSSGGTLEDSWRVMGLQTDPPLLVPNYTKIVGEQGGKLGAPWTSTSREGTGKRDYKRGSKERWVDVQTKKVVKWKEAWSCPCSLELGRRDRLSRYGKERGSNYFYIKSQNTSQRGAKSYPYGHVTEGTIFVLEAREKQRKKERSLKTPVASKLGKQRRKEG